MFGVVTFLSHSSTMPLQFHSAGGWFCVVKALGRHKGLGPCVSANSVFPFSFSALSSSHRGVGVSSSSSSLLLKTATAARENLQGEGLSPRDFTFSPVAVNKKPKPSGASSIRFSDVAYGRGNSMNGYVDGARSSNQSWRALSGAPREWVGGFSSKHLRGIAIARERGFQRTSRFRGFGGSRRGRKGCGV